MLDTTPEAEQMLGKIQHLIHLYNREGIGVELSKAGVEGHLSSDDAVRKSHKANKLLGKINRLFSALVCRTIGSTWYQVPAHFSLGVADSPGSANAPCFTISHLNCGRHEFDFVINDDGRAEVIAERYDDLGVPW